MGVMHVTDLSSDGYSRFFVIVSILQQVYKGRAASLKILDVGGCSQYLTQELVARGVPHELTIMDILPKPKGLKAARYIQGDATASGLPDNSYDVVVSTDTLEHIPKDRKDAFVREAVRIARELCILAAPFDTPGVHEAEAAVNDFNKKLFGSGQDWLEEHFEFGKPDLARTRKILDAAKVPYVTFGTNNLISWLINTHTNLIEGKLGLNGRKHKQLNRAYNARVLESSEFSGPTYRQFLVVFKNPALQARFKPETFEGKADNAVVTGEYIHQLMELVADQFMENKRAHTRTVKQLQKELHQSRTEHAALIDAYRALEAEHAALLRKLGPLKKVVRPHRAGKAAEQQ